MYTCVRPSTETVLWFDYITLNSYLKWCQHNVHIQALSQDAALAKYTVVQLL